MWLARQMVISNILKRAGASQTLRIPTISSRRGIALQTGSRVRGLLRDPQDYLVSSNGRKYDEQNASSLVINIKQYLNKHKIDNLDDQLLLQVLTHKSFAHGKKRFNEKLAVLGYHLVKQASALNFINKTQTIEQQQLIEGFNFDILGTNSSKVIMFKATVAEFARLNIPQITNDVFWRNRNVLITDPAQNGENLVLTDTVHALVGAVNLSKGHNVALEFVDSAMMNGENSLVSLAERL